MTPLRFLAHPMLYKNKRILWLLNHKTLMQYEVPLLLKMGFEVFVPKIIPRTTEFRSGAVDFSFDESLTIPAHVLRILNSCHFYQRNWPRDVVFYMNRYFGSAFVMPIEEQFRESVINFEGNLLMRAFGLINTESYHEDLNGIYGEQVLRKIVCDKRARKGVRKSICAEDISRRNETRALLPVGSWQENIATLEGIRFAPSNSTLERWS
jgi:hypothetical protein